MSQVPDNASKPALRSVANTHSDAGPLAGLRVIDAGTRISAPFCAGLLGEMGAEVIKVELPGGGDFMRTMGPFVESDDGPYSLSWAVEGRGRKGVTCDLRSKEGKELFRKLCNSADVLCENFRPGTMEKWDLGPGDLNPDLIYVRISVFGQSGPYAPRPGLDRLGIAYGGLLHLTGDPDRPPVRPGVTVSDYLTGVFAAMAAISALYERDSKTEGNEHLAPSSSPKGVMIDAPLYGSILRILEWTLAGYDQLGIVRSREGNRLGHSAPLDNYPTKDGRFVCIVAGSDANFQRLCRAMDKEDLSRDPRFATLAERAARGSEINEIVADWTRGLGSKEIEECCIKYDVPVGTAYSAKDIFSDPHIQDRGDLVSVDDPIIGPIRQQAPFPRFGTDAPNAPIGAPRLGEHNETIWCTLLGLSKVDLDEYQEKGII